MTLISNNTSDPTNIIDDSHAKSLLAKEGDKNNLGHNSQEKTDYLSSKETREVFTPFAFKIDKSLFGLSLATPRRRFVALTIDLFFIALLSGAPGELLAILIAITLFRLGSKKGQNKKEKLGAGKVAIRVLAAFVVVLVLMEVLPPLFSSVDELNRKVNEAGQSEPVNHFISINNVDVSSKDFAIFMKYSYKISNSECKIYQCWQDESEELLMTYIDKSPLNEHPELFADVLLDNISEKSSLTTKEHIMLEKYLYQQLSKKTENIEVIKQVEETKESMKNVKAENDDKSDTVFEMGNRKDSGFHFKINDEYRDFSFYKGLAFLQKLLQKLGLGFGWAAFYFTMFTALWSGQTLGKKMLGIRVIQLDGTPLSVWDSFGRYGGYGAGLATGLLGFIQIFWDANRQCIHDKISSTIVIRGDVDKD